MEKPKLGQFYAYRWYDDEWINVRVVAISENDVSYRRDYSPGKPTYNVPLDEWIRHTTPDKPPRPSWDDYFISMCHLVATRATCDRKHVGAVVVRDRRVLATGYNGSAPGEAHCDDVGHDLVRLAEGGENCVRTIHAEANAITQAARYGVRIEGAEIYTNTYPCWPCAKLILSAGISRVIVDSDYKNDPRVESAFGAKSVALVRYKKTEERK